MTKQDIHQHSDPGLFRYQGETADDPLLDCLMQLGRLYNLQMSRTAMRAGLPLVDNRLTVELFPRAAARAGLASRLLKRPLSRMTGLELPAVLLLEDSRACLLAAVDFQNQEATVLLPEADLGETRLALEELEQLYSGYAFFVRPRFRQDAQSRKVGIPEHKHWFWGTIFSSWRIYRDVLLASLLINIFGLAGPFFTMNVYDRVIPNLAFDTLWVLAVGIGIIYFFNLLMRGLRGYFIDEAGKKANLRISAALLEKVLGLRLEVRPKSVGAFSKNLQQFESVRDFITSFSITGLIDLPFMVLALTAIWYLGGPLVYIHLTAVVLMALFGLLIQAPLKHAVEKSFQASAQKNSILVEGLSGIETVKLLGAEGQIQRAWEEAVSYIAIWSSRSRLFSSSVSHFSDLIMNLTVVGVVIGGVYRIAAGELSQGGIIALVILSRQAIAPMSQVVNLATRYHRAKIALATLDKIMELPVERPTETSFLHRGHCQGRITLTNLEFSYPEQKSPALKNISLTIEPGERVAIIGPIGSGKTTLGKLLLGLYQPTGGMVCLDDTDIRQIDPAELRRFIGYVPQDITLFRGSIRDNIILGSPDVDDSLILRAAELSGVNDFVGKHAKGFDLEVGEQGRGLSGGQQQCVALARALLHDPPILILDEPTSSMDNRTESRLKTNLLKLLNNKTLILITHRGSLLDLVDRIVLIDNATVVADGPRDQVLNAMKSGQIQL
ncbi:type I secretion system permease/ATPase [Desulfobulbus alkaliphilus]|uniref:type I secretion system permease/ATPase n=1 Tax=Desulfobulbus alkaliphilus TaxID=869814 RepID=UPI0019630777|nr:type I secretion system permease/ATPase [Desulfobulbus alkaliphilus]MBM9538129.1 type I secretion system permease/ATPase [Desulfobulbus alkaliphilus]